MNQLAPCLLLLLVSSVVSADCNNYRKIADNLCAETCLGSTTGICPVSVIVKYGGLDDGTCAEAGYTKNEGQIEQKAGPCGTLVFVKYSKLSTLLQSSPSSDDDLLKALAPLQTINYRTEELRQPRNDDCKWSLKDLSCVDKDLCSFQYRFGDLSLDESCRLRSEKKSCDAIEVVADLDPSEYFSGRWFEIATTDGFRSRAEKGLSCISADYTFNKCFKNPVVVTNAGVNENGEPKVAVGKARAGPSSGKFEVSFFGPIFAPYWVVHVESTPEHKYGVAIVVSCSGTSQTMWFLSRTPQLPASGSSYERLLEIAQEKGVDVASLEDFTPSDQHDSCVYPAPETLNPVPSSDDGCTFGIFGCAPSSWCSFQFRWGDLTPNQSCRLKPTACDDGVQFEDEGEYQTAMETADEDDGKGGETVTKESAELNPAIFIGVGAVSVGAVAVALFTVKRRKVSAPVANSIDMYTRC